MVEGFGGQIEEMLGVADEVERFGILVAKHLPGQVAHKAAQHHTLHVVVDVVVFLQANGPFDVLEGLFIIAIDPVQVMACIVIPEVGAARAIFGQGFKDFMPNQRIDLVDLFDERAECLPVVHLFRFLIVAVDEQLPEHLVDHVGFCVDLGGDILDQVAGNIPQRLLPLVAFAMRQNAQHLLGQHPVHDAHFAMLHHEQFGRPFSH